LCQYPETATFLSNDERQFVIRTRREDSLGQATHFSAKFIWQALADWKTYVQILNYIGYVVVTILIDMKRVTCQLCSVVIPVYAVALFTPTIIHNLGFSAAGAQLLSIPPFVCGCISTIITGIYSDKMNSRGPFVVLGASVSMIGYIVAYVTSEPGPGYAAAIIAATGVYPTIAVNLAWAGGNAGGDLKRGVVLAMVIGIGNLGGYAAILLSPMSSDVGMQYLFLVHILPTTAIPQGPWHHYRLSRHEVCTRSSIPGITQQLSLIWQLRLQLHSDVEIQCA